MKLSDFGFNEYSQFGEDGMIDEALKRIGVRASRCVEFGAADGLSCSNTARLWQASGWEALLIERDEELSRILDDNVGGKKAVTIHQTIEPTGAHSIDALLTFHGWTDVDFMSIDVDGADYLIWEQMTTRPRLICIEYNPSVPPTASLHQADAQGTFGQSALALVELGTRRGYELIGLSHCNLVFVVVEEAEVFNDLERDLNTLFDYSQLAYLVTDYLGHVACLGTPPWGVAGPYLGDLVGPAHLLPRSVPELAHSVDELCQAYEAIYGRAVFIDPTWHNIADLNGPAFARLDDVLVLKPPIVLIDVRFVAEPDRLRWIPEVVKSRGYSYRLHDRLLVALLRDAE